MDNNELAKEIRLLHKRVSKCDKRSAKRDRKLGERLDAHEAGCIKDRAETHLYLKLICGVGTAIGLAVIGFEVQRVLGG